MIGRTLGHYRILDKIGAGGMGEVYRAHDERLERDVALKVLPAATVVDESARKHFRKEALTLSKLKHAHIAHVYDYDTQDGVDFLVMEYVEGTPLKDKLTKGWLPEEMILHLGAQVADALEGAHEQGIIHRDLKPGNIVLTKKGDAKVLDFGLAKLVEPEATIAEAATVDSITASRAMFGTLPYMPPEQLLGATVDARSDIYSFGVVLYEMAAGKRPFQEKTSPGLAASILQQAPRPPSSVNPQLSAGLEDIILKCLEKEPEQRYQSAKELRPDLERLSRETKSGRPATRRAPRSATAASSPAEELWVAVLPFKFPGGDADLEALADGLSEDIITGLSRFPYLHVIARNSTLRFKGQAVDVRTFGKDLGARYVLEGSVRKSGSSVRVGAQVVDARTGAHLWAETYDRDLAATTLFALQDDVTAKVVATIADAYGVLPRSMGVLVRARSVESLNPYEAVLRLFGYYHLLTREEHREVRTCLERAVEQAPNYADAWASLALMYLEEHKHGFNARPDPLGRSLAAARRAVELDPANQLAYFALATTYFFSKDFDDFRLAADRALALNPLDGNTMGWMGLLIAYSGEWDRGVALAADAMTLNPHHPGWYHFGGFWNHYFKGNYEQALESVRKINMPSYFYWHAALAASCGQLGRLEEARKGATELLRLFPSFPVKAREEVGKWQVPDHVEHFIEGLRKAGLEIAPASSAGSPSAVELPEKSVAVLPFANLSGATEDEYFSDGITEEIINALARVAGLKVAARTSAFSFKGKNVHVGDIGRALNVSSVLEGSVLRAGRRLRITAQLVNVADGCHLWSERFDRELDDIFAVQDEIATAIAKKLEVSISGARGPLVKAATRNMEAYECYLKGLHARQHFGTNLTPALDFFERATALDPGFAPAHAGVAQTYANLAFTAALRPRDGMPKAKSAALRALQLDGGLAEAHCTLAVVNMLYDRDWGGAERSFLRALELSPNDPQAVFYYGHIYLAYVASRPQEGIELCRRALETDPLAGYPLHGLVSNLVILGRNNDVIGLCQRELERDPSAFHERRLLGLGLFAEGRWDEARVAMEEAVRTSGRHTWALIELGMLHARCGRQAEAEAILEEAVSRSRVAYVQPTILAVIPSWLGRFDQAFAFLDRAFEEQDAALPAISAWPDWSPLADQPRYRDLLTKLGLQDFHKNRVIRKP